MPPIVLSQAQIEAAFQAASSELKFHLAELGVDEELQAILFHSGFTSLRLLAGIDETRAGVRDAVRDEFGIDYTASLDNRKKVALLLSAWEGAKVQVEAEDKQKAESKASSVPRLMGITEHALMRTAVENVIGTFRETEVPSKSFLSAKMEQIENNDPRVEDLKEVTCVEDSEVDLMAGYVDVTSGTFRMRPSKSTIGLPENPEELRQRHRRIAIAWTMLATKHTNRSWIGRDHIETYRKLSDHVLGKHIAGLTSSDSSGSTLRASWQQVLSYDHEVRKEAYKRIRHGESGDIATALGAACADPTLLQLYFIIPLTLSSTRSRGSGLSHERPVWQHPGKGDSKGDGKGPNRKGGGKKDSKHGKIPVQKKVVKYCYKYNSNKGCPGGCGYDHLCQKCNGPHPRQKCTQKGGPGQDTGKA